MKNLFTHASIQQLIYAIQRNIEFLFHKNNCCQRVLIIIIIYIN